MLQEKRPCIQRPSMAIGLVIGVLLLGCIVQRMPRHLRWSGRAAYYMTEDTNVIFDLNDTLFTINTHKALSRLGFGDILGYFLSGKRTADLENTLFKVLDSIRPQKNLHKADALIPMHKGRPLPLLMQEWMVGSLTSQDIIDTVIPHIDHLAREGFFASKREERIIKKTVLMMFDPQIRCDLYQPIKRGIKLAQQCKQAGNKVYLLSNMDTDLINLLSAKHPDIFELFDGIIISADVNAMKPHKDIYEYTLATYHLDPERSYFIDDEQENIEGAQQVGITGIHCNYKHYKKIKHQLKELGLLTNTTRMA